MGWITFSAHAWHNSTKMIARLKIPPELYVISVVIKLNLDGCVLPLRYSNYNSTYRVVIIYALSVHGVLLLCTSQS